MNSGENWLVKIGDNPELIQAFIASIGNSPSTTQNYIYIILQKRNWMGRSKKVHKYYALEDVRGIMKLRTYFAT